MWIVQFLSFSLLAVGVSAECNTDDHHPENGGYFYVGVAGLSTDENLDSAHGQRLPNNTWAMNIEYPHGQNKVDPSIEACSTSPGCPQIMDSHTCSILRFCPPANAQTEDAQIVYRMLDEESMNSCDFDTATEIGTTLQAGSDDGCVEYAFEEDHELTDYFFSSPEGCDSGQKLMIHIEDFTETAEQCKAIGNASSRIRNCDCRFEKKESTLPEPCRTAFSDQCEFMTVKTDTCCEEGTCLSKIEDYNDPLGKEAETKRQAECDDNTPGLCYNEDGLGTDTNRQGSTNCCTRTCTECGIQDNPFALWKPCTSGNANDQTANCGFLSRYDQEAFVCDFSKCEEDDHWHPSRDPYKKYFKIVEDSNQQDDTNQDDSSASMVGTFFGLLTLSAAVVF